MAELDFPSPPWTDQQVFGNYIYSTAVGAWTAKPLTGPKTVFGATPPANPQLGDEWTNSNDFTTYTWYVDVDGGQWVEKRSQIAKSQVGLVPIVPTSVNVGSGTASVDVGGMTTFTNSNAVRLNGIFTSAYSKYRIVLNIRNSGSTGNFSVQGRFSLAGTDSSVNYDVGAFAFLASTGGTQQLGGLNGSQFYAGRTYDAGVETMSVFDVGNVALAQNTTWTGNCIGSYPSDLQVTVIGGVHRVATAYDGFYIGMGGSSTGTMKVYGYN